MKTSAKLLLEIILIIVLAVMLIVACNDRPSVTEGGKTKNVTEQYSPQELSEPAPVAEKKPANRNANGFFNFNDNAVSLTATDATSANSAWQVNSSGTGFISSSAAVEDKKDTARKFIRTADMKFRVKNILQATYSIENITKEFNGFVTRTILSSNIDSKTVVPVSADSSVETIFYTVVNDMTLRVPNTNLDTTLKTISSLIDYLDYRTIKADDIALQLLQNRLAQDRASKSAKRITAAIDDQGRKLKETTAAEELLESKQEQADAALIANLELKDKIDFSTITLSIYQRQTIKRDLVSNHKNIDAYRPGFGARFIDALKIGWEILEEIIVFLGETWSLLVLALCGYLLYRIWRPRKN